MGLFLKRTVIFLRNTAARKDAYGALWQECWTGAGKPGFEYLLSCENSQGDTGLSLRLKLEADNILFSQGTQIDLRELTLLLLFSQYLLWSERFYRLWEEGKKTCLTNIKYEMNVHATSNNGCFKNHVPLFSEKTCCFQSNLPHRVSVRMKRGNSNFPCSWRSTCNVNALHLQLLGAFEAYYIPWCPWILLMTVWWVQETLKPRISWSVAVL